VLKLVVPVPVVAHLLYLVNSSASRFVALALFLDFLSISVGISPEAANLDLAGSHGSLWVNDNGEVRLEHVVLMQSLVVHVNSRQPAAVARVTVVPSSDAFLSIALVLSLDVVNHVLVGIVSRIDSRFSGFDGKSKGIHDHEGVSFALALEKAHDFDVAS